MWVLRCRAGLLAANNVLPRALPLTILATQQPAARRHVPGALCSEKQVRDTRRRALGAAGLAAGATGDPELDTGSTNLYVSNMFRSVNEQARPSRHLVHARCA
jgi:hypothetical protein